MEFEPCKSLAHASRAGGGGAAESAPPAGAPPTAVREERGELEETRTRGVPSCRLCCDASSTKVGPYSYLCRGKGGGQMALSAMTGRQLPAARGSRATHSDLSVGEAPPSSGRNVLQLKHALANAHSLRQQVSSGYSVPSVCTCSRESTTRRRMSSNARFSQVQVTRGQPLRAALLHLQLRTGGCARW